MLFNLISSKSSRNSPISVHVVMEGSDTILAKVLGFKPADDLIVTFAVPVD